MPLRDMGREQIWMLPRRLTNWRRWRSLMFRICRGVNRDMIPHLSITYVSVYRAFIYQSFPRVIRELILPISIANRAL